MVNADIEKLIVELAEYKRCCYFGKYRGIVEEVGEGEHLGQIIAKVPAVYGEENSPWALPSVPFAGKNHGFVMLPEKRDGVWIEFEAGNPSCPIWTGCWWAKGEIPQPGDKDIRVLATSGKHKIILDDGDKKLQLLHSGGAEITMTDNDITLKIGSTQIVLSKSGVNINNGAFEVKKVG
jgi:uncharacterized protein involved in type VI secretion and phage assembly